MSVKLGTGLGRHMGMVLIADKVTGLGRWIEIRSNHTTLIGLTEYLRDGTRKRRWFAWKIVVVESEGGPTSPEGYPPSYAR